MFNVYKKYLISNFIRKFLFISFIFFCLVIILSILEEISFFKNLQANFYYPYLLTLLNSPITLFEIFPFIFLLTTQYFFYDLFDKNELTILKINGIDNFKIIKILFLSSILIGILNLLFYYNIASSMKFKYSEIKNKFSDDNKYLAMINDDGLWIKDEVNNKKIIVNSKLINENILNNNIINEFNDNFELLRIIKADDINIKNYNWIVSNPIIIKVDNSKSTEKEIILKSNFNAKSINNLFSNISTLNLIKLFKLKKNYEKIGYSSKEVEIHMLKLISMPLLYGLMSVLSAVIMFNSKRNRSLFFYILNGIFLSVMIYYLNFIFNSLGAAEVIPIFISIYFPIIILMLITMIGLIKINEK